MKAGALIMGPAVVGQNSTVGADVYIGPYTSIGNNVVIKRGEIINSIVMDGCLLDVKERITDSIIGPNTKIVSNAESKPSGRKFILGESSQVAL